MKKIGYIIEKFPSPTEYFVLNEMLELEKNGVELVVLVLKKQKTHMNLSELTDLKASVIYLPKIYRCFSFLIFFRNPLIFLRSFKLSLNGVSKETLKNIRDYSIGIYFFLKLKRISIVHFHAHFAFLAVDIASAMSKISGLNYSVTVHANDIYTNNISKIKKIIAESSFVITCTEYNWQYLNELSFNKFQHKIYKIYHGIDVSKWTIKKTTNIDLSEIKIICIARLTEKKGLIYLLESIKILLDNGNNIKCTIVGEGTMKVKMIDFITLNKLEKFITIKDFLEQNQIRVLLSESDIFVLPSIIADDGDRDGLPNVIVEAMSLGIPVVSTYTSAVPEIIENRITGLLVKQKNSLAIAKAISELVQDQKLYSLISKNAKSKIGSKLSIEHSTEKILKLFQTFIFSKKDNNVG